MRPLLLTLIVVSLGWVVPAKALADNSTTSQPAPVTDPTQVDAHYREMLQRPEFHETGEADVDERLRDVLAQWFYSLGQKMSEFKYVNQLSRVASVVLTCMIVFCVAGIIYVIVRLCRRRSDYDFNEEVAAPGQKTFRPPEFYEKEIRDAVAAGGWHAAWLAAWRQFLSRLESRQLVEADRTRTNREYLAQLREKTLPSPALELVGTLVDAYDRFIYGRRPIAEPDWIHFQSQVGEAGLLLHLGGGNPPPAAGPHAP